MIGPETAAKLEARLAGINTGCCVRAWCIVEALADAHRVIKKPTAKKERIVFAPLTIKILRPLINAKSDARL